jgi:hypothetical protein
VADIAVVQRSEQLPVAMLEGRVAKKPVQNMRST